MRRIISVLMVALLSACASHGVMVSDEQVSQFKRGVTTEADVVAHLGTPTTVVNRNGVHSIIYSGAQAQARPASFIPFIGPLVGGTDVRASNVTFTFGPDGKLTDLVSTRTASGGATGFASATVKPVSDSPRQVE